MRTRVTVGGLSLLAALLVLAAFTPRFVVWCGLGIPEALIFPEVNRAVDALRQLREPFAEIANPSNRVLEWRLLFPLLGRALRLSERLFLALPALGILLVLGYQAKVLLARGWRADEALAGLIVVGATPWFFVSSGWLAYFDAWLVLALLLCSFSPSRRVVAVAVLLAPWIDERFLFVLPMSLILREWRLRTEGAPRGWPEQRRELLMLGVALLPFVAVRAGAMLLGPSRGTMVVLDLADANRSRSGWRDYLDGIWQGLRFGWVLAMGWLLRARAAAPRHMLAVLATAGVALAAMFGLAADYSRSAATLAPLVLAGLAWGTPPPGWRRRFALWGLAVLSLLAPAAHVVNDTRVELRALPHELAAWRNPPAVLRADTYNLRATVLLIDQQPAAALPVLGHALQLEPDFAPAHLNRSTALARLGRWPEALAAADRAVALDATLARAWFARAEARAHTGDPRGALTDARRAATLAPDGDPLQARARALAEMLQGRL